MRWNVKSCDLGGGSIFTCCLAEKTKKVMADWRIQGWTPLPTWTPTIKYSVGMYWGLVLCETLGLRTTQRCSDQYISILFIFRLPSIFDHAGRLKSNRSFFKAAQSHKGQTDPASQQHQSVSMELQSYLFLSNADSVVDPLVWWKAHKEQYPRLCSLARKYLCIPATSSPSERVFSTGGNIVSCRRSALKPQNVDRLVFLAKNL